MRVGGANPLASQSHIPAAAAAAVGLLVSYLYCDRSLFRQMQKAVRKLAAVTSLVIIFVGHAHQYGLQQFRANICPEVSLVATHLTENSVSALL